ncbi:hypothetical protein [Nocardioides sp. URHA0020]|uniref:hypothetical protein n=1 Tax=Nocardioides sp. URHA0020 TaxID=1380392 RepID=UPI0012DF4949|nr:hypothetical protein [Nocardioides sp. URHA0020]
MSPIGDLVYLATVFASPAVVIAASLPLLVTRQPRWVTATTVGLTFTAATSFIIYWYLWGRAFEYEDTNYKPAPPALDTALSIAIGVCQASTLTLIALGGFRLVTACQDRPARQRAATDVPSV